MQFGATRSCSWGRIHERQESSFITFAFLLLSSLGALVQGGTTGGIDGTVKDKSGAVIVGAEITVVSRATGEERKVISDTKGRLCRMLCVTTEPKRNCYSSVVK